jgi:hypothetical protein
VSAEPVFVAVYTVLLLAVVGVLEFQRRQPTSAWDARVFTGYRRAVPDAPRPADPADWPHSEVGRFHVVLSLFISAIALVLVAAELVRHHRPLESAALVAAASPHALVAYRYLRHLRPRRGPHGQDARRQDQQPQEEP